MVTDRDDLADTLMSADERVHGLDGPVALLGVQVGMAHTGVGDLDEALSGLEVLWLLDGVGVADLDGLADGSDDGGGLGLGNGDHGVVVGGDVSVGVLVCG